MNRSLTIILLLLTICGFTEATAQHIIQTETNNKNQGKIKTSPQCKKGIKAAKKDDKKGDWGFYFYGNYSPRYTTWVRVAQEELQLKIKGGGDISSQEGDCYNRIMRAKIKEKFGEDAFKKINRKVDSLYAIGLGDRPAKYKGEKKEFLAYIYCNLPDELLSENNNTPTILLQFSIDKAGKVINKGIVNENQFAETTPHHAAIANKIVNNMPDWDPAIENQKAIFFETYTLPIKFAKTMKEKYCGE